MTIFDIQKDLNYLYEVIENNGGELTEELAKQLDITEANYNSKLEQYYNMLKLQEGELNLIKSEAEKYKVYKKRIDNLKDRLSNVVSNSLKLFGKPTKSGGFEYKQATFRFLLSPSATYEIDAELVNEIKEAYLEVVEEYINVNNTNDLSNMDVVWVADYINKIINGKRELDAANKGLLEFDKVNIDYNDLSKIKFTMPLEFTLTDISNVYNNHSLVSTKMLDVLPSLDCSTSKSEAKDCFNNGYNIAIKRVNENLKVD